MKKNQAAKHSLLKVNTKSPLPENDLLPLPVYRLHEIRDITPGTYILRFDRNDMNFKAGQHITLGLSGGNQLREYSIYSSEYDPYLEVLIKEVEKGMVSKSLRRCNPGAFLNVDGPFGFFTLNENNIGKKHLFVGTGTGIAPFHSMAGSVPHLDYTILHGVRTFDETYESSFYPYERYISCTSRDDRGKFSGRVTDYIRKYPVGSETIVYLCGNVEMIYEVYEILVNQRFSVDQIKTEDHQL
ncbi:MAG: FAD-binding oxidoreductase [Bacteroidales bacterium]